MIVGLSSYSLGKAMKQGKMDILSAMDWIKENGGDFVEVVPHLFTVNGDDELIGKISSKSEEIGLPVLQYSVPGNVLKDTEKEYEKEIDRLKTEIDTAVKLGAKVVRHDLVQIPSNDYATTANFEKNIGRIIEAAKEIAVYAQKYGIKTSIENHGVFVNRCENIIRIAEGVGMDNFGLTLDVGNFVCVDEDPEASVKRCLPYAVSVHFKDFYLRNRFAMRSYAEHMQKSGCYGISYMGNFYRGAIVGMGDMDLLAIAEAVKSSGYDGGVTIEFEGMEDCCDASRLAMENTKALLGL